MIGPLTTVDRLMTAPVVTLHREQSLPLAERVMEREHIRHLPVVDDDGRLVGLVTQRDLLAARIGTLCGLAEEDRTDLQLPVPVAEFMTRDPWTVAPSTAAWRTARGLATRRVGCAPVVDPDGRLLGIVTVSDLLSALVDLAPRSRELTVERIMTPAPVTARDDETLASVTGRMRCAAVRHLPVVDPHHHLIGVLSQRDLLAARRSALSPAPAFDAAFDVSDVLSEIAWSISPDSSVRTAARLLRDHSFGCLPVTSGGRVVGIVTDTDILSLAARLFAGDEDPLEPSVSRVEDYMSAPVVCAGADDRIGSARSLFDRCEISSLPVVAESGALIGVITRADLTELGADRDDLPVGDVMTRRVHTIAPAEPITAAAAAIVSCGVHGLIVVEEGEPIGVLRVGDLFAAARDLRLEVPLCEIMSPVLLSIEVSESIAVARRFLAQTGVTGVVVRDRNWPVGVFSRREALRLPDASDYAPVETIMSRALLSLPGDLPLWRAADQAAAMKIRRIVVVQGGQAVGVVTGTDVAGALADSIPPASLGEIDLTKRLLIGPKARRRAPEKAAAR